MKLGEFLAKVKEATGVSLDAGDDSSHQIVLYTNRFLNSEGELEVLIPDGIVAPFRCVSVLGGWQTEDAKGVRFGPTFNDTLDLWNWQGDNLPDCD